jgi:hypothetical protein
MPRSLPWSVPTSGRTLLGRPSLGRLENQTFSCMTQPSLGTRNGPLSETERDPSNSSKMTGIFDYTILNMAPREPGGTAPVDFLTLPQEERALPDLRKLDSNCVPSPISSHAFQRLYPTLMYQPDPDLPILLASDCFASSTTISRRKEFGKERSSRRRYGHTASQPEANSPIFCRTLSTTSSTTC